MTMKVDWLTTPGHKLQTAKEFLRLVSLSFSLPLSWFSTPGSRCMVNVVRAVLQTSSTPSVTLVMIAFLWALNRMKLSAGTLDVLYKGPIEPRYSKACQAKPYHSPLNFPENVSNSDTTIWRVEQEMSDGNAGLKEGYWYNVRNKVRISSHEGSAYRT